MPLVLPTYLVDTSGQQWLVRTDNNAVPQVVPVSGVPAVSFLYLNSVTDGITFRLTIVGNPPPVGENWGDFHVEQSISQGSYPTQLIVLAPNGTPYAIQIATIVPPTVTTMAQGIIQSAFPITIPGCDTSIDTLAANVINRVEESNPSVFWIKNYEIYTALVEAENDLMMLVGRPTQTVNVPFTLTPNTVWQRVPKGIFLITDIWGSQSQIRKCSLYDLDYSQASWGSDWENDTDDAGPLRWAPLGVGMFAVHPAPTAAMSVTLDAIAYPVASSAFPYTGSETVPFHHEMFSALEEYAAVYLRLKEMGPEFTEAMSVYQNYLTMASRLTEIEDRRDRLIFDRAFGAPAGVQSRLKR